MFSFDGNVAYLRAMSLFRDRFASRRSNLIILILGIFILLWLTIFIKIHRLEKASTESVIHHTDLHIKFQLINKLYG